MSRLQREALKLTGIGRASGRTMGGRCQQRGRTSQWAQKKELSVYARLLALLIREQTTDYVYSEVAQTVKRKALSLLVVL